jgi:hypothetical protein
MEDLPKDIVDISTIQMPMGYVDCQVARADVASAFAAAGVDISGKTVAGEFQRKLSQGVSYINLHDFEVDFIRGQGASLVKSRRPVLDCGILSPLDQKTGICDGCSHSTAAWLAWVARFVNAGDCPVPREVTFLAPYLMGRQGLRGDSGAYPNYTCKGYYENGVLPVDAGGKYKLRDMTIYQQEDVCVALRDNPVLLAEWLDAMAPLKTRVFNPNSGSLVADCIASYYPVTFGTCMQGNTAPNPGGVASLYVLRDPWMRPAGHETVGSGIAAYRGRIILLRSESWFGANFFPGGSFPGHRVAIHTDNGTKLLYPGQSAVWLDEWMNANVECWGVGWPGSAA